MNKLLASFILTVAFSIPLYSQEHAAPRPTSTPNPTTNAPATNGGWVMYRSEAGRFSVLMPGTPETKEETTDSEHGPYVTTLSVLRDSTNIYLVGFVDYDPSFNFNRRAEMEANRDNFVKGVKATLLSTADRTIDGYSVIEFVAETAERVFNSRVYMVGRRPYQIAFVSAKGVDDSVKKNRFFNSFKISNGTGANVPTGPSIPSGPPVSTGPFDTAESYYDRGEVLYKEKKYSEALPFYQRAVQVNPSMANALYRIGWIYNDRENYNTAVESLKKAVALNSKYTAAYFELGYANKKLDNYNEALSAFQQAVRLKPDYAEAYYQIGWIYNDQNRFNDAVMSLKLATSYRADYPEAHNELGYALHQLKRYSEAIREYQTAIAQRQDFASAIYNLGMTYVEIKNRNAALDQYRTLQRIDTARATKLFNAMK